MQQSRPPFYQIRVRDLIEGSAGVSAICFLCGHEGPVDTARLLARHGEHERLVWIEHRLRCSACRVNTGCSFKVTWPAE